MKFAKALSGLVLIVRMIAGSYPARSRQFLNRVISPSVHFDRLGMRLTFFQMPFGWFVSANIHGLKLAFD